MSLICKIVDKFWNASNERRFSSVPEPRPGADVMCTCVV